MHFGNAIAKACSTFALTNIDDMFVLVTFFALAAAGKTTPLKITIGQYLGFTVIVAISMIGFAASLVLPPEPIGFLGWVPMMLGVSGVLGLLFTFRNRDGDGDGDGAEETEQAEEGGKRNALKQISNVALVTISNGGDNISTYTPLFAQAKGAEIAVYVVTYYILLGTWCLVAYLVIKQRHVVALAEKYARFGIPWLYVGLGVYIVVSSECYPWSVREIDDDLSSKQGSVILGVVTAVVIGGVVGAMVWIRLRRRAARRAAEEDGEVGVTADDGLDGSTQEVESGKKQEYRVDDHPQDQVGFPESVGSQYVVPGPEVPGADVIDRDSRR
ncbi:hypothetical protein PMIN06_001485 [Paraphaeosphaeria minitans]|uniref:Cadmium resistance transporter n=1 Tax=Paraphaeosphaeria minitans TaxID=565426 RepID=A0A9P6GIN7_9PLEO|nr:cadmium resistance transporter [Paraphaeosphaeria minitans]